MKIAQFIEKYWKIDRARLGLFNDTWRSKIGSDVEKSGIFHIIDKIGPETLRENPKKM